MSMFYYTDDHLNRLREFFAEKERNKKLKAIIEDFPDTNEIKQLNREKLIHLHIKVIKSFLQDVYLHFRRELVKWAEITRQTAIVDPEYISMHFVSLFLGISGTGTAARGFDLSDGSEVKSSSRVEQLGKCKNCGAAVMAFEEKCGFCGSTNIDRKYDSHWIFSLKSEEEVQKLLSRPALYLVLLDYPDINNKNVVRIRLWKLDTQDIFVKVFFRDYYFEEYFKRKIKEGETPAPCNLHPDRPLTKSLKPLLLFTGKIKFEESKIDIEFINSTGMPETLSEKEARSLIRENKEFFKKLKQIGLKDTYLRRIEEITDRKSSKISSF
jgi:ribosomal protein S27AE